MGREGPDQRRATDRTPIRKLTALAGSRADKSDLAQPPSCAAIWSVTFAANRASWASFLDDTGCGTTALW